MNIDDITIDVGTPEFSFEPVRRLQVKCEATNALMPAPTVAEANGRLRALAAKAGADAVVEVEYNSGVSFTSWKSLKATGLAVRRISDETTCAVCAETIKRAALKCRHCGAERPPQDEAISQSTGERSEDDAIVPTTGLDPRLQEPLSDNNNPAIIIGLVVLVLAFIGAVVGAVH